MAGNTTKPLYINTTGPSGPADLPSQPPFFFRDVTSRAFPIKANMARLTFFCDQYLNMDIPPHIAHFCPALPYVYLMVLNYGSMSPTSVQAQNLGWVAQHEVLFMVPLEWWREEKGRLVFKDWACVSPFIFVDDEVSLTTGREVYGWPKMTCVIEPETPLWTQDPGAPTRLCSMSAPVFPKLYAGAREEWKTLMHIDREPALSFWQFPPDPFNLWNPFAILSNAAQSTLSLMQEAADLMTALPIRGYRSNREWSDMSTMVNKAGRSFVQLLPDLLRPGRRQVSTQGESRVPEPYVKQITLKQFRDAADPRHACYQALVASSMGLDRVNRSGLLGDVNLLRGDPSGGFTIRMYCYPTYPIVESLGIEVVRKEEGEGASVAILKPTFPFWTDVDMYYGTGEVICSRAACFHEDKRCHEWTDEQPDYGNLAPAPCARPAAAKTPGPNRHMSSASTEASGLLYNTICGGATQPVAGPFHFPDVTLQVYPLLADPNRLRNFLNDYLNEPLTNSGLTFKPIGAYVYLMATVYGGQEGMMWSEVNNIGWWRDKEVSFSLPVKVYWKNDLITLGMVSPFVYGNSGRAVITDREVNGSSAIKATIESPPDVWLSPSGPVADRLMLKLDIEVFPALHMGLEAVQRTLIEIDGRMPLSWDNRVGWDHLAAKWREPLLRDLERKTSFKAMNQEVVDNVKALALEILAQDAPVNFLTLKQYRDAKDVDRACYQALVKTGRSVSSIRDIREWEKPLHVRIHKYPGLPIAETLGLTVKHEDSLGDSVVQYFQPIRPFWMRLSLEEPRGEVLCWRTRDGGWNPSHPWLTRQDSQKGDPADLPIFDGPGLATVGPALGTEGVLWQGLREVTNRWTREAMDMELPVINKVLHGLTKPAQYKFRAGLSPSLREDFRHHQWDILKLATSKTTQELYRVLEEVWTPLMEKVLKKKSGRNQKTPTGEEKAVSKTTSELYRVQFKKATALFKSALTKELNRIAEKYQKERNKYQKELKEGKKGREFKVFTERLSSTIHMDLAHAGNNGYDIKELWEILKWDWNKFWAVKEIARALKLTPSESLSVFPLRLSREQARHSIEHLQDLQLVIECILRDEWENQDDESRVSLGRPRKPDFCIPVHSFGCAGFGEWESRLETFDGAWRCFDPNDIQGRTAGAQPPQKTPKKGS